MSKTKRKTAPYLIMCLVFLFNPNINVIDILPDFIAYFIIARMLEKPADSAPYFEEARASAVRLGWITLMKIPAFFLAIFIRTNNTLDRDIYPMLSLVFAVLEIIFLIGFINNLSKAFFYLGERGTASTLIAPFSTSKSKKHMMRPEELRAYTIMFAVCKALLFSLPEFFLLSGTTSDGTIRPAPLIKYYPPTLLFALILGFVIGGIWLSRAKRYAENVAEEGEFTNSLTFLARSETDKKFETRTKLRSINNALLLIVVSAVLSFRLALKETSDINILPGILSAAVLLFALFKLKQHTGTNINSALVSGGVYSIFSVCSLAFAIAFHDKYSYSNLISMDAAKGAYIPLIIFSILEFLALSVFLFFCAKQLLSFIDTNTGLSPKSDRYGKAERQFHKELKTRAVIMFALGGLLGLAKCSDVILNYNIKIIHSDVNNSIVAIEASPLPWFGVVITLLGIAYAGYALYFTGRLNEECSMKYSLD